MVKSSAISTQSGFDELNTASKLVMPSFPSTKDFLRVDWLGEVDYVDRTTISRPSVRVYLSRVRLWPDRYESIGNHDNQISVWVTIGQIMLLRIGDIWQNQLPIHRPAYTPAVFPNLLINKKTFRLAKAGERDAGANYLLPVSVHPWHMNNTRSNCALVSTPDDAWLAVPCIELIRFYFGSSTQLLTQLFDPPLQAYNLYSGYRERKGDVQLTLAGSIPGASSEDVARIAGSEEAFRAASLIGASCQRQKQQRPFEAVYPDAKFPFEGQTELKAAGEWIGSFEKKPVFLAFRIDSCSHPFPFKSLRQR